MANRRVRLFRRSVEVQPHGKVLDTQYFVPLTLEELN